MGMNLWEFFQEGGWGMYPTMGLGLVTLVVAARFAWAPERKRLGFIFAIGATTLGQIVHATLTDVAAVFRALANQPTADIRVLFEGFKECTRPGILGGVFLVLALLFVSLGLIHASARET
jgi:hypothetical protein